jgi:LPXTG-site transpeptidase (sortase) family protein
VYGDPGLASLTDNGGFTRTMALGAHSAAIDAIAGCNSAPATDQRGTARPKGAACDIGAYEYVDTTAPTVETFTATSPVSVVNIPITALTGSDDVAVTGYLITESSTPPTASASGWVSSVPTTYTIAGSGDYTLYPWVKDGSGNVSAVFGTPLTISVDIGPRVVDVTSSTADGAYPAGTAITVLVKFDENAVVTGHPQLTLETGSTDQTADYDSGSGTDTLSFTYTVAAGDTTSDLDYVSTAALAFHGGTIRDTLSHDADLTMPAPAAVHSLGANKAIVIDTTPPDTNFTSTLPGNPTNSTAASFSFDGSDGSGVGVTGFECRIDSGSYAACTSPQGYTSLADGSHTVDVRALDSVGNVESTPASYTWTVDTAAPTVTVSSVTTSPTNTSPITVRLVFNKSVSGFTPSVASGGISIGGVGGTDADPQKIDSSTYSFDLTPSTDGAVTVTVPAGAAQDAAGNWNVVSNTFSITYDTTSPAASIVKAAGQNDPTNTGPIQFTVTFTKAVTGFTSADVTLGGTAGADTAHVTGSGTSYTVVVSGMTTTGTVTAEIPAGVTQDEASNLNTAAPAASVAYDIQPFTVALDQESTQVDPTHAGPITFVAVFNKPINPTTFTVEDVSLTGTATGSLTADILEMAPMDATTYRISVSGMSGTGTVIAGIGSGQVQDLAGNGNAASTSTDKSVTYDSGAPQVSTTSLSASMTTGPSKITVKFNEPVSDPAGDTDPDDVSNPSNYHLLNKGANGLSERTACNLTPPATSDDGIIAIDSVSYDSGSTTATLSINGGVALPVGSYELFVCGTTSIVDLAGNPINNGLTDYVTDFSVVPVSLKKKLPGTGFAQDEITMLPVQPREKTYTDMDMWLEIPALGVKQTIVGVSAVSGWDVTWLGSQIGYLEGTAFPTWAGNSVLTGHVTDANGKPGPFASLGTLKYGDQIIITAFGQKHIYEVQTVDPQVSPADASVLKKHEDLPWLTLITCHGYDEKTKTYRWRTIVRAELVEVVDGK